jgi:hypothetical protein
LAKRTATAAAAPQEMPTRMPSSVARRRAISTASSLSTCSTRSTTDEVERVGDEARADALDLVRAGLQFLAGQLLRDDRAFARLHGHGQDLLALHVLDVARDAGDGAARADAGDEHVDRAVGVVPDFRAGGLFVNRRVGWILELLGQEIFRRLGRGDFFRAA